MNSNEIPVAAEALEFPTRAPAKPSIRTAADRAIRPFDLSSWAHRVRVQLAPAPRKPAVPAVELQQHLVSAKHLDTRPTLTV